MAHEWQRCNAVLLDIEHLAGSLRCVLDGLPDGARRSVPPAVVEEARAALEVAFRKLRKVCERVANATDPEVIEVEEPFFLGRRPAAD